MSTHLSRTSVSAIYREIINELGNGVREDLLEIGVDEEVSSEFKQIWQQKLTKTKVALVDEGNILDATRSFSSPRISQSGSSLETTHNANQFHNRLGGQININRVLMNPNVQSSSLPSEYQNSGYRMKSYGEYCKPLTEEQIRKLNLMKNSGFKIENVLKDLQGSTASIGLQNFKQPMHPSQIQGHSRALSKEEVQELRQNGLLHVKGLRGPLGMGNTHDRNSPSCSSEFQQLNNNCPATSTMNQKYKKGNKDIDKTKIPQVDGVDNVSEDNETDDDDFEAVTNISEEEEEEERNDNENLAIFNNVDDSDVSLDGIFDESILKGEVDSDHESEETANLMKRYENCDDAIKNCEAEINSNDDEDQTHRKNFSEELSNNTYKNIIYCNFEKIGRRRMKWIMKFTNGIMHANGKDYVFGKLNGSAEFK